MSSLRNNNEKPSENSPICYGNIKYNIKQGFNKTAVSQGSYYWHIFSNDNSLSAELFCAGRPQEVIYGGEVASCGQYQSIKIYCEPNILNGNCSGTICYQSQLADNELG